MKHTNKKSADTVNKSAEDVSVRSLNGNKELKSKMEQALNKNKFVANNTVDGADNNGSNAKTSVKSNEKLSNIAISRIDSQINKEKTGKGNKVSLFKDKQSVKSNNINKIASLAKKTKNKQVKLRRKEYEILKLRQRNKIIALSVFILVMLIFATTLYFFDTHYPLNTTFRGNDLSLKPKYDKIITPLNEVFTIKGSFGDPIKIDLSSLGGEVHTTVTNNPYPIYWIENSINGLELEGTDEYYYDENKLKKWLEEHIGEMQGNRLPTNASLQIDDDGVKIIPETDSNIFADAETFIESTISAVNKGMNEISTDDFYRKASIRTSDLQAEYDRISNMKINIPQLKTDIGPKSIMSMYNDDKTVNEEVVEKYCWTLSENYDTYKKRRHFITHSGQEIELEPGDYGWRMDVETTKNDLIALLNQGGQGDLEITYQRTAKQYGDDDIGNTYIEVSRDEQKVYLFINGKLELDCDVVTGDPTRGHQTDAGVQMIYGKYREARLVAEGNEDPRDNYNVPVECWMPFHGGEGFHSADWYADWQFGGGTYYGNGSHGCVNMKLPDVKRLFDLVDIGTPVIVY